MEPVLSAEYDDWSARSGSRTPSISRAGLPAGVAIKDLVPHADDRGEFTEVHRDEWLTGNRPVQWNAVRSKANVLRGVHVHRRHTDRIVVIEGVMLLGLHDVRPDSPTHGQSVLVELTNRSPRVATIPPGVAHGFFFPEPSLHIYAVSRYFDPEDELGCRFDSPELGFRWPVADPLLSTRDAEAASYGEMVARIMATGSQPKTVPTGR
jgi:dTDP-4-dehydrorhamnose 3,5-epimerase